MPKKKARKPAKARKLKKVSYITKGFHTVTPYLALRGAAEALEWYKKVFGAQEIGRMLNPEGKLGHAEIRIGDSIVMLSEEFPEYGVHSPQALGGSPVGLFVYVKDVDTLYARALQAGAKGEQGPQDMFWGDRFSKLTDPFGHRWQLATHKEDVSHKELEKRAEAFYASMAAQKQ